MKGDDDVLEVDFARALELLAMPKRGRGGRTALKDLGVPKGSEEKVQVFDGPYGLYVKQGKVNASLPDGKTAEDISLEEASELLLAKTASKKVSRKKSTKKTPKKKATPKAKKSSSSQKQVLTKKGRLRASQVKVIKPEGN